MVDILPGAVHEGIHVNILLTVAASHVFTCCWIPIFLSSLIKMAASSIFSRLVCRLKLCIIFLLKSWGFFANKANLRDLIAATGLVILLILDQIINFLVCMILKFDRRPWKTIGHLFYATSSFVHHFVAIGQFKLELQSGTRPMLERRKTLGH